MAKTTLIDIVQEILADADGDNVNSISDTVESDQAARVVKSIFEDIVDNMDLEHHLTIKRLDATTTSTPSTMTRPEGFHSIEWIKYDKRTTAGGDPNYELVNYVTPERFLQIVQSRSESDTNITAYATDSGHELLIRTDKAPDCWTILEGYDSIVFDSYDSSLDSNLQQSKSLAYGLQRPTLTLADASVPDLPQHLMSLLRNRSKAYFMDVHGPGVTREVDKRSRNSEVRAQRLRHVTKNLEPTQTGQNYGRK